jgi:hypothetical protein
MTLKDVETGCCRVHSSYIPEISISTARPGEQWAQADKVPRARHLQILEVRIEIDLSQRPDPKPKN